MPDPVRVSLALLVSALVSAVLLALLSWRAAAGSLGQRAAGVVAMAGGFAAGTLLLLRVGWPPASALDRFLTIVLPATLTVEGLAFLALVPASVIRGLRIVLALAIGRILLDGSVYLGGPHRLWSPAAALGFFGGSAAVLLAEWGLLTRLFDRSPGFSVPLSLAGTIGAVGLAVPFAGYVTGGLAALPPAAALVGTVLATGTLRRPVTPLRGTIGIGVVTLFSLVAIGRFFGGLATWEALLLLLAPLCGWGTELPPVRRQGLGSLTVGLLRLLCVVLPILMVLGIAFRDFQLRTLPLL